MCKLFAKILKQTLGCSAVAALFALASLPAAADDILPPVRAEKPLILGLGAIYRDKTYRGYDDGDKWQPIPLIMWENEHFYFRGSSGGWKAWTNDYFEFAILAQFRGDGYDSGDSNFLAGMDDRDPTVDGGAHIAFKDGPWGLKATWVHDLGDKHEGYEARGEASYTWVADNKHWIVVPSAQIIYQSDDLVNYYYGVEADEATAIRAAYDADNEFIWRLQTVVSWNPGGSKWELIFGGRYDFQGDEYDDSTITSDDQMLTGFFAAGYRF